MSDETEAGSVEVHFDDRGNAVEAPARHTASEPNASSAAADAARAAADRDYWRTQRDLQHLANAELTVSSAAKATRAELKQAVETGDVDQLDEAVDRKVNIALSKHVLEMQRQQLHQAPPPPADPVERYVQGRPAATQQWLREHKDWVVDPAKNAKLTRAHYGAIGEGLNPDTPDYFKEIERRIGLDRQPEGRYQRNIPGFDKSNPATHVRGNQVFLTKSEAERATDGSVVWNEADLRAGRITDRSLIGCPIQIQEYARRKKAMMADGMYNRLG